MGAWRLIGWGFTLLARHCAVPCEVDGPREFCNIWLISRLDSHLSADPLNLLDPADGAPASGVLLFDPGSIEPRWA
jgi:hypothetical protein